jgi:zinc transport system substrate-binding protein
MAAGWRMRIGAVSAAGLAGLALAAPAAAQPSVVVTIKPLHSLVAQVMAGAGVPELLVKGTASPHTYAMKPSDARALNGAALFLRMAETVEPFTVKVVRSLPKTVEVVTMQQAPGVKLLARRTGATFERHSHGGGKSHGHDHGHSHDKAEAVDGHTWLDPDNAKAMVARIAEVLAAKDPPRAALYKANAAVLTAKLDALAAELARELAPVAAKPYVVFHDALQYLERRYDLNVVGSIFVSPDVPPSAKRITELRRKIVSLGAVCVFAEPQFDTRLINNLIEGVPAKTGTLDPEGLALEPAPDLYFTLMRNLATSLRGCLGPGA